MDPTGALRDAIRDDAAGVGVFVDYDGTLAPIVLDPEAAVPAPGAADVLVALSARVGRVVVVSGRPVAFLQRHLPPEVDAVGLYGLEERRSGVLAEHPIAASWRPVVDEVATAAVDELPRGVEVEHKGLSLTLHTRRHPDEAAAAEAWAAAAVGRWGLELRPAKHSVELHPPVAVDKGTVLDDLLVGLSAACFVGDDSGDLPAFAALERFAAAGGTALRVVVASEETPATVRAVADLEVDGPEGALDLLRSLAG